MGAIKKPREIDRAAFQLPNHGRTILFVHVNDAGTDEYRMENFRGLVLDSEVKPRKLFVNWVGERVAKVIEEVKAEMRVSA